MKTCTKCQAEKEENDFYPNRAVCKICYGTTRKPYRDANKTQIQEYHRSYATKNGKRLRKYRRKLAKNGYYRRRYRDGGNVQMANYYQQNRTRILEYRQKYTHTPEYLAARRKYMQKKRDTDPHYKLRCNISRRIRDVLKSLSKSASTLTLLGCDVATLKNHLESKFQVGMTWNNYNQKGWHIDHIRPCASFNLNDPQQQKECFHYTNLQPLWAKDNLSKGNKTQGNGPLTPKATVLPCGSPIVD